MSIAVAAWAGLAGWLAPARLAAGALAVLSIAGAGAWAGWTLHGWRVDAARTAEAEERREADRMARAAADNRYRRTDHDTQARTRRAEAAAAGARDELERLRLALSPEPATGLPAACAGVAARAAVVERLFSECAAEYQAVARDAGRYADQVRGWNDLVPDAPGAGPPADDE